MPLNRARGVKPQNKVGGHSNFKGKEEERIIVSELS